MSLFPTDVHPILENRQRLAIYLMAWIPIGAIFTVILKRGMTASWPEAILVAVADVASLRVHVPERMVCLSRRTDAATVRGPASDNPFRSVASCRVVRGLRSVKSGSLHRTLG